jgi:hypothetical protein
VWIGQVHLVPSDPVRLLFRQPISEGASESPGTDAIEQTAMFYNVGIDYARVVAALCYDLLESADVVSL